MTANGSSTLAGETECSKNKSDYVPIPQRGSPVDHFNKQEINKKVKEDACKQGQLEEPQASLIV